MRADTPSPTTLAQAGARFGDGSLGVEALTRHFPEAISARPPQLNTFITVTDDLALETAAALDNEFKAGSEEKADFVRGGGIVEFLGLNAVFAEHQATRIRRHINQMVGQRRVPVPVTLDMKIHAHGFLRKAQGLAHIVGQRFTSNFLDESQRR